MRAEDLFKGVELQRRAEAEAALRKAEAIYKYSPVPRASILLMKKEGQVVTMQEAPPPWIWRFLMGVFMGFVWFDATGKSEECINVCADQIQRRFFER